MQSHSALVLSVFLLAACGSNDISLRDLRENGWSIARYQIGTHSESDIFGGFGTWYTDQVRVGPDPDPFGDRFDCSENTTPITAKLAGRELNVRVDCTHVVIDTYENIQDDKRESTLQLDDGDDSWRILGTFRRHTLLPEPPLGEADPPKLHRVDQVKLRIDPPARMTGVVARIENRGLLDTTVEDDEIIISLAGSTEGKTQIDVVATPLLGENECVGPSECRGVEVRTTVVVDVARW